jgi:hypothetical protein
MEFLEYRLLKLQISHIDEKIKKLDKLANATGISYPRRWDKEKLFTEVLPFKRAGVTNKHLAEKYGVSQSRMSQIIAKALQMEKNHIRLNLGANNDS